MASPTTTMTPPVAPVRTPRRRSKPADRGLDRGFRYVAVLSGILILAVLASVALFLVIEAAPALSNPDLGLRGPLDPRGRQPLVGRRSPHLRHRPGGHRLAGHRSAGGGRDRAVHLALRAAADGVGARLRRGPARGHPVRGVRGSGECWCWRPRCSRSGSSWWTTWAGSRSSRGDDHGNASNPPRVLMTTAIVLAVMILPIITAVSRERSSCRPRGCTRRPPWPSAPRAGS